MLTFKCEIRHKNEHVRQFIDNLLILERWIASALTLSCLLLHEQEQHVFHVVLNGTGLIGRDGPEAGAAASRVT